MDSTGVSPGEKGIVTETDTILRNKNILQSLERGRIPILPFELAVANNALQALGVKRAELSARMNEAMTQSSETWHDNAPAEAITNDSKALAKAAEQQIRIINSSDVYECDTSEAGIVTLGSLVAVRFGNSSELTLMYLTGATRGVTDDILAELCGGDEVDIVTLSSPIGKLIFGLTEGDTAVLLAPNGREISISIGDVKQVLLATTEAKE